MRQTMNGESIVATLIKLNLRYLKKLIRFIDCRLPKVATQLRRRINGGPRRTYGPPLTGRRRVLIMTCAQDYNGGSIVATYATKALQSRGFDVLLCAPSFDRKLGDELLAQGLSICEFPLQMYSLPQELAWVKQFDFAIVNVFQSASVAVQVSRLIPTIWWIHECSDKTTGIYTETRQRFPKFTTLESIRPLNTYAVSRIAQRAIEEFYPGCVRGLLPFGIPDECSPAAKDCDGVLTLALIGGVHPRKAQLFFEDVYRRIKTPSTRALLIGSYDESDAYTREVLAAAAEIDSLELTGNLTREDMRRAFTDIDIVVCPSTEETVSIAVIEGLMNGKICIMSDNVGVADVIEDGVNGFICRTGDEDSLAAKMDYAITHFTELDDMRARARTTYEQHFSMESFGEQLEALVNAYIPPSTKH